MVVAAAQRVVATLTAGPFGSLYATLPTPLDSWGGNYLISFTGAAMAMGVYVGGPGLPTGLNLAGQGAVAGVVSDYYADLSAEQVAAIGGVAKTQISYNGFSFSCAAADITSLTASLVTILDNAENYGAVPGTS
jgi:hypothetical protein